MIDLTLSKEILNKYNTREIGQEEKVALKSIPKVDNRIIVNFKDDISYKLTRKEVDSFFSNYNIPKNLKDELRNLNFVANNKILEKIGVFLYPYFSYGVLNGGSATSYIDKIKNKQFNNELYNNNHDIIESLSPLYKDLPKGITPAFINKNGSSGPSFMELKMRSLLIEAKRYKTVTGRETKKLFPIFQMTSLSNNESINSFYEKSNNSPFLMTLIKETGIDITNVKSGIQPLITAFP